MTDVTLETSELFKEWDNKLTHEDYAHEHYVDTDNHWPQKLNNGCYIWVRARQLNEKVVEVFFGAYRADGKVIKEKIKQRENVSCKDAIAFGKDEATRYAGGGGGAPADNHHQATPI
ncbi:hypothetical protein [Pseudomonas sp. UBA4194]|jgi:cyclopropane fatty-acyl-phospholipid synthase-like methyltransferase|uniref:hypothetical protein n=1 Tax=Pseudomonas sp. UBA4194 TaxID=1947317 RepID=UPI0025CCB3E5|nr:hypothetical protein [Pseudomonas sp. UBA4194]